MKITFTKIRAALLACSFGLWFGQSEAQICSASNTTGCSLDWFSGVIIKNAAGTTASYSGLNCNNTGPTNKLMTNGAIMDVTPGELITITIENTCNYAEYAGVWIDMDGDNSFSAAECIGKANGPIGQVASNTTKTAQLQIPCGNFPAGKRILRIRCMYLSFLPSQGCGSVANEGNIMDFEINVKAVNPPQADFTVPVGPNYIKTPITFNSTSTTNAYAQTWKFSSATPVTSVGPKGRASWSNIGFYNVQLNQEFCGLKDSIVKSVKIEKPTMAPVADFIAGTNQVEVFYQAQLFDLSTNGAYKWDWTATSPSGAIVYTSTQQNPFFSFDEEGWWEVCLTSSNDVGPSSKVCKARYIEVVPPGEFLLGPNHLATNQGGILYDNGGRDVNYGNNRKTSIDYFKILPCGAKEIRLTFTQLKLSLGDGGDRLRIYDGPDESGKELTPAGGITGVNQSVLRSSVFKAFSGSMYITFESNSANNDSGFIAIWDSELFPTKQPKSDFTTPYLVVGNGADVIFTEAVKEAQGIVNYNWMIDGTDGYGQGEAAYTHTFGTDGTFEVCLIAEVCNGNDTACKNITVITTTEPKELDFTASNLRPKVGESITLTTNTDYASRFEWSIFPATFSYAGTSNSGSRNPQLIFNAGGAYTFTLRAWNAAGGRAATEKKVIKTKYVIAVKYCAPTTDMLSSDVAISKVELLQDSVSLLENTSAVGESSYTDYTDNFNIALSYGSEYSVILTRRTNSNTANFKAWIDYNIDGVFSDNEMILSSGTISGTKANAKFRVPDLKDCFEGVTRMRVATSYGGFSNTSCGVNIVGEFEDYGITLKNDKRAPVITLLGDAVVRVEKNASSAKGCWSESAYTTYKAADPTEGDLTSKVVVTSDLDCTTPGTYSVNFRVVDAAGNEASPVSRTVIVVLDKTAPVLTLLGKDTVAVEQCAVYSEQGAVANDNTDGNLSSDIAISGVVNTSKVGSYPLTYTVSDAQGNTSTAQRVVKVVDTKKPGIFSYGKRIVNNEEVQIQIGTLFVDAVTGFDTCNGSIMVNKVPGYNGLVNTLVRATYPITYYAVDPHGNKAVEDGYTINYRVDDYIAPEIALNTPDTVFHEVNAPYSSQSVTVFDNYYVSTKISIERSGKVNPYVLGLYTESFKATDESGNSTTKKRYVKVVDRQAPSIITSAVNVCVGTPFWAMSDLAVEDNYYGNDELLPLVKVLSHNVNIYRAGIYYINYQVTDPSGNKSQVVLRPVYVQFPPNCENSFLSNAELTLSQKVMVHPNPTDGKFQVSYNFNSNEAAVVTVTDMTGRVVKQSRVEGGIGSEYFQLEGAAAGTYLVTIATASEKVTEKLIVTK